MSRFFIRPIELQDNHGIARVIRTVMPEFGASGPGFAIHDPEVDSMFEAYQTAGHRYFVVSDGKDIFGGAGVAPLGGVKGVCELRKMYFLEQIRGHGLGQKLMDECLSAARELKYQKCYLETLKNMQKAKALYHRNNFMTLAEPMGDTGHFGCDNWYLRALTD